MYPGSPTEDGGGGGGAKTGEALGLILGQKTGGWIKMQTEDKQTEGRMAKQEAGLPRLRKMDKWRD